MTSLRPTRKPAFLWQAGLILLPVLIIAAVALTAIIENRTAVEREARRRAEEVARQYGKELERPVGVLPDAARPVFPAMERLPGASGGRLARQPASARNWRPRRPSSRSATRGRNWRSGRRSIRDCGRRRCFPTGSG